MELSTRNYPVHLQAKPSMDIILLTGDGVRSGAEDNALELLSHTTTQELLRFLSLIRNQQRVVKFPTPDLHGGKSSSEDAVQPCDGNVFRLALLLSTQYPGALRPSKSVPSFTVPVPALLACLERLANKVLHSRHAHSSPEKVWRGLALTQSLLVHQRSAVDDLLSRDQDGSRRGHFVFMDTGTGKTLTAVAYLVALNDKNQLPKFVLWVIPRAAVDNVVSTIAKAGAPACVLPITGKGKIKVATPTAGFVNVVCCDHLRIVVDSLVEVAHDCILVVDEADTCYDKTLRTSAAKQIAAVAHKVICMTATPMRSTKTEGLANWLSFCVDYYIDSSNWWVAANAIVSKQLDLGVALQEEDVVVPFDQSIRAEYEAALRSRDWLRTARIAWDATDQHMAKVAASESSKGVLLVARDSDHAEKLSSLIASCGVSVCVFTGADPGTHSQVVVVRKDQCRGYNWAVRLGVLIRSAYPSNAADRKQMIGRLRRIGQHRDTVTLKNVVMQSTIVALLLERHRVTEQINASLEQLGDQFGKELWDALNKA